MCLLFLFLCLFLLSIFFVCLCHYSFSYVEVLPVCLSHYSFSYLEVYLFASLLVQLVVGVTFSILPLRSIN